MSQQRPHYFQSSWIQKTDEKLNVDVCIYGATAAGVVAAATAAEQGHSVALLQPGLHLGGMTTGGLGWTDTGREYVIGGASRKFYEAVGKFYHKPIEWHFAPSAAMTVMEEIARSPGITLRKAQFLDKIRMDGKRIVEINLLGGLSVSAKIFIDATYEGDLLAKAGVTFHIGREGNDVYGERLNGSQVRGSHQFDPPRVDPFVVPGDASSGLLPWIENIDMRKQQCRGDQRVQAYNFRMCMTNDPKLKIDWVKPEHFEPSWYELAARWFAQPQKDHNNDQVRKIDARIGGMVPAKFDVLPNQTANGFYKTDTNNHGPVSSDFIGANWAWPQADYQTREQIFQNHVNYQKGLYWFMANDERVPAIYREAYARWGLPRDEFTQTGNWPHQLYVREARRMIGDYVITEHDCTHKAKATDSIGMGSYTMDSHNCTRFVAEIDGQARVMNDGDVQVPPTDPYSISYRAVVPKKGECENLLVPVCFSASHIAYGSARMEPVFMVLGESCGIAASMAIKAGVTAHEVDYPKLRATLEKRGQILEHHKV